MTMRSTLVGLAIAGLTGALIGSFFTMPLASPRVANVAYSGDAPVTETAPLPFSRGSDENRIVNAIKKVEPSVVALTVVVNGKQYVPSDPFAHQLGAPHVMVPKRVRSQVSGSGFVYSRDGLIVTNAHVLTAGGVGQPSTIMVLFGNGDRVPGRLLSANAGVDLALVKVDYPKLPPPLTLADSNKLRTGQWAIAIGEPLELQKSATVGVVSGFNRNEVAGGEGGTTAQAFKDLLQTSAPINPGNSGGPLIDSDGRVIGVNQLTANPSAAQGISFAIPSNTVRTVALELSKGH